VILVVQQMTTVAANEGTNWDRWVAIGTLLLALATFALAAITFVMARHARSSVRIQESQLVAAQRPYVYPVINERWLPDAVATNPYVVLKNGGAGPAFNVKGAIYWTNGAGGASSLAQTALAAGEDESVRVLGEGIRVDFNNARGYVRYTDSTGRGWQTHFRYTGTAGLIVSGTLNVEILVSDATDALGEPQYNNEMWVNAPPGVTQT
jgi:hypothetical protein